MQIGELRVRLAGRGVSTESASDFLACLEQCDRQRFAPAGAEIEERIQFLERAGAAMTMLDGALR
jgi:hypothetical protein